MMPAARAWKPTFTDHCTACPACGHPRRPRTPSTPLAGAAHQCGRCGQVWGHVLFALAPRTLKPGGEAWLLAHAGRLD
jgi:hypothetical protein